MRTVKLITESSFNYEVKEGADSLFIEGVFSTAEVMNNNGRRYPRKVLEREIAKLMECVNNKTCFGELAHPDTPELNLDRVAILTTELKWLGEDVVGKAKVLKDTPMGHIASVLIKEGKLGISSRGLGTVNESDNCVNEDFNLLRYDIVGDPSNPGSWVRGIYEGKTFSVPGEEDPIVVVEEPIVVVPSMSLEEARKEYKRHIWQVLEQIGREL